VFLGCGKGAQQLYLHTLECPGNPVYPTDATRMKSGVSSGSSALLSSAHPAGIQVYMYLHSYLVSGIVYKVSTWA
jgi:hypothetical protein